VAPSTSTAPTGHSLLRSKLVLRRRTSSSAKAAAAATADSVSAGLVDHKRVDFGKQLQGLM
jgi:hypothetical protein